MFLGPTYRHFHF